MLTFEEKVSIFNKLKEQSGSHSPSITSLFKEIDDLKIDVDACFLSNPYATELFFSFLKSELIETQKIFGVIEYYPAQNKSIAKSLSSAIKVPAKNVKNFNYQEVWTLRTRRRADDLLSQNSA